MFSHRSKFTLNVISLSSQLLSTHSNIIPCTLYSTSRNYSKSERNSVHNTSARGNLLRRDSDFAFGGARENGTRDNDAKQVRKSQDRRDSRDSSAFSNRNKSKRSSTYKPDESPPPPNYKGPDFAFSPAKKSKSAKAVDKATRQSTKRGIHSDKFSEAFRSQEHMLQSSMRNNAASPTSIKKKRSDAYLDAKMQQILGQSKIPATDDPKLLRLAQRGRIQKLREAMPKHLDTPHKILLLQCAINGRLSHVAKRMFVQWPALEVDPEAVVQMAIGVWGKEGDEEDISARIDFVDRNATKYSQKQLIRNAYINALVRNDKVDEAWDKFRELFTLEKHPEDHPEEARKVEPTIVSFSTLMGGYAAKGNTEKLDELYTIMADLDILYLRTDSYVHNLFLQAAVVRNDEDMLWYYFKQYFNSRVLAGTENNILAPNIITVNTILKFYAQRGDAKKMESYLRQFEQEDPKRRLNSRTAQILLQGYFTANQLGKAEEIFRLYYNYGIRKHNGIFEAPLEVCHIMLEVFDRTNQLEPMQELFDRMFLGRTAAAPEKSTFELVIQAYKKRSSYDANAAANLKKMQRLLEKYEKDAQKKAEAANGKQEGIAVGAAEGLDATNEDTGDEPDEDALFADEEEDAEFPDHDLDEDIEEELTEEYEDSKDEDHKERYLW